MVEQGYKIKIKESDNLSYQKTIDGLKIKYFDGRYTDNIRSYDILPSIYEDEYLVIGLSIINSIWINLYVLNLRTRNFDLINYDIEVEENKILKVIDKNRTSNILKVKLLQDIEIETCLKIDFLNSNDLYKISNIDKYKEIVEQNKGNIFYIGDYVRYVYSEDIYKLVNIRYITYNKYNITLELNNEYVSLKVDLDELELVKRGKKSILHNTAVIKEIGRYIV